MNIEKIHEDSRGSITLITAGEREFLLLETFDDKMRGADMHHSPQHDLVLSGEILWIQKPCSRCPEKHMIVKEGETATTEPNIPHMMVSRGYSIVLEWCEKPKLEYQGGKFVKRYYPPFQELVEASK